MTMRPPATFHRVDSWLRELDLASNRHMKVVLIGNKCDLADGDSLVGMNRRQVSTQEARAYASGRGLLYEEASAKDGTNVHSIFENLTNAVVAGVHANEIELNWDLTGVRQSNHRMSGRDLGGGRRAIPQCPTFGIWGVWCLQGCPTSAAR